ncbi:MAG: hypothetical protein HFE43_08300 [Oscillospiraceae bacterium]|jgi:hypothetical protein|nr:hypothetical protein [Oscillospiraceae bacterium]
MSKLPDVPPLDMRDFVPVHISDEPMLVDKIVTNEWDKGGPLVGVRYARISEEENQKRKERLIEIASAVRARIEQGLPPG